MPKPVLADWNTAVNSLFHWKPELLYQSSIYETWNAGLQRLVSWWKKAIVKCICSFYWLRSLILVKSNLLVIFAQDILVSMQMRGIRVLWNESKCFVIANAIQLLLISQRLCWTKRIRVFNEHVFADKKKSRHIKDRCIVWDGIILDGILVGGK